MAQTVLILGHSFVFRLQQFIAQNSDPRVSMNFNLKSEEVSVAYLGKRGACIKQIRASGLDIVTRMKPSVVLVQGVSNDLCDKNRTVDEVFKELVEFIIHLRYEIGVKKVVVLQTLYRRPPTRFIRYNVDVPWFNDRVEALNQRMSSYLKNVDGTTFFRMTGFWSAESQQRVYLPDGVHLNDEGNKKYYNNIRACIVSSLNSLDNGGGGIDSRLPLLLSKRLNTFQMSDPTTLRRPRGRKPKRVEAAAGSEEQLEAMCSPSRRRPDPDRETENGNDNGDNAMPPALVEAVTQQVLQTLRQEKEGSALADKRGRSQKRGPKQKRRRLRSPTPSSSGTSSESSELTDSSDESDSDVGGNHLLSTPIAIQVESKLKNKIWQNMYIEFDKLLPKEDLNPEDMSVRLQSSGKSEFKLVKSKTKNTI